MRKGRIISTVLILVFILSCCFANASAELVKKEIFISETKKASYDAPKEIEEGGKAYRLKKIDYKVIRSPEELKGEVEIKNLNEKKVPLTKNIEIDGKKYTLYLDTGKTKYKKDNKEEKYVYEARDPNNFVPEQTRIFKHADGKELTGKLKSTVKGQNYGKGITVPGRFDGSPNAKYFRFAGSGNFYPLDTSVPTWKGYEGDILAHLGLNPNTHSITGGRWTGTDGSGKNAVFSGTRTVCDYTCTYTTEGGGDTYTANAVYNGYEIEASAIYEEYMTLKTKILIGIGIGILTLAVAVIIYFLKRRKKNKEEQYI